MLRLWLAATNDLVAEGYTPTQVDREILELFDWLKDRLQQDGFLDAFKKDGSSIGRLI